MKKLVLGGNHNKGQIGEPAEAAELVWEIDDAIEKLPNSVSLEFLSKSIACLLPAYMGEHYRLDLVIGNYGPSGALESMKWPY